MSEADKPSGLALLRVPFPPHQISKLPKPTKAQTEAVRADFRKGARCSVCGAWHHPDVIHLDYVGHAALTDRLLDADPAWSWEPVAFGPDGNPLVDADGGMWIKLTVCGVTRFGYGDSQDKSGPNAVKERIGDALRNAAMRFGAALDLWHKGDLHVEDAETAKSSATVAADMVASNITPNADAEKNVNAEQKAKVDKIASEIIDCFEAGQPETALEVYEEAVLLMEEKLYLWTLLGSKERNTLKRLGKAKQDAKNLRETHPVQA